MKAARELWLTAGAGPVDLVDRVAWWRDREEAALACGPPELAQEVLAPRVRPEEPRLPEGLHGLANQWLPIQAVRREVHAVLRAWFGEPLRELGAELDRGELARARSWLDARRRIRSVTPLERPSQLLAGLSQAQRAHDLLFELFAPPAFGAHVDRYPERLDALRALLSPRAHLRVWDAGCATGEGTWELARALLPHAERLEVLGSELCAVAALMAERRARPHDPARTRRLRRFLEEDPGLLDPERCQVTFARHDLLDPPPGAGYDLVVCHGVLGGTLPAADEVRRAVGHMAAALAPGGILSVTDRFRADRARRGGRLVSAAAGRAGLEALRPGLFRARG